MIRLCFIISSLAPQGPVFVLYNLLKYIDYSKYEILIICLKKNSCNARTVKFKELKVQILELDYYGKFDLFRLFKRIKYELDLFKPDIIHSHCFRSNILSYLLSYKYKFVTTVHIYPGIQITKVYGFILGHFMCFITKYVLKHSSYAVSCSKSVRNDLEKFDGIKSFAIPNGVDVPIAKKSKIECREKLNLPENSKIFISIGRFSPEKNFLELINYFSSPGFADYYLIILGEGRQFSQLSTFKASNIILPGFVSNTDEYLQASDFYISASITEGLPMAVLEAMSFGLPVLLSDIPSHKEIIDSSQKGIGFIFENCNYESFKDAFEKLICFNYKFLEDNVKYVFDSFYRAEIMSKRYQELYVKISKLNKNESKYKTIQFF